MQIFKKLIARKPDNSYPESPLPENLPRTLREAAQHLKDHRPTKDILEAITRAADRLEELEMTVTYIAGHTKEQTTRQMARDAMEQG